MMKKAMLQPAAQLLLHSRLKRSPCFNVSLHSLLHNHTVSTLAMLSLKTNIRCHPQQLYSSCCLSLTHPRACKDGQPELHHSGGGTLLEPTQLCQQRASQPR